MLLAQGFLERRGMRQRRDDDGRLVQSKTFRDTISSGVFLTLQVTRRPCNSNVRPGWIDAEGIRQRPLLQFF
jgi:hypothetical protein